MSRIVYLGDPVGAAGFRLAGVEASAPEVGEERDAIEAALATCELLMVTARVAATLPQGRREALESALAPRFVVLPDSADIDLPPDRLSGVLGQLGVES